MLLPSCMRPAMHTEVKSTLDFQSKQLSTSRAESLQISALEILPSRPVAFPIYPKKSFLKYLGSRNGKS